jgi:mono/diheme cytochrome c family protein
LHSAWRDRLAAAIFCVAGIGASRAADIKLPDGPGVNLVYAKCQTCHDLQYVAEGKGLLGAQWNAVVASMKDYGMVLSGEEQKQIVQYLSTYLGPHPPQASTSSAAAQAPSTAAQAPGADGRSVFAESCASCHGADGRGQPGSFPPLAANPDLAKDRLFPVLVVLHGIAGPIQVNGHEYNASMPSFAHLSDAEIAAAVNYVLNAWGSDRPATPVAPAMVAEARKRGMTPDDVRRYRGALR